MERYRVTLTDDERQDLENAVRKALKKTTFDSES